MRVCLFRVDLLTAFFTILFLGSVTVFSQGYKAEIVGTVTDASGAAVQGCHITVTNLGTNETLAAETGDDGEYLVSQLIPGSYSVIAEKQGFRRFVLREVEVHIDQTARVDVALSVGEVTEQVTVTDDVPVINSETPALGHVITNGEIVDIPLNGRNYLTLALLSPGVVPAAAGQNPHNINGSRSDYVNYLVDGVPNVNRRGNEPITTPSIDAIQEFKVITNSFSAEYGRLGGGVISVGLKSGTNDVHGTLYEFHRNSALDARSFFDTRKLNLVRNQFGGVATGPIRRDRTFFLFSYEGLRNRQGDTRLTRVPTTEERNGVFSTRIRNPYSNQFFANNTITPSLIDPIARQLLAYFPLPNRSGQLNYVTDATTADDQDNFIVRVDHQLNEKNRLNGEFLLNTGSGTNPFRSSPLPGFGSTRKSNKQLWSLGYTRVFSGGVINEARFGYARDRFDEHSVNAGENTTSDVGIAGAADGYGLINIAINGYAELGDPTFLPDEWRDNEFSFSDTVGFTVGSHYMKAGADFQLSRFTNLFASFAGGQIAFNGGFTQNPFADFLLGLPLATQRQVGTNRNRLSSNYYGLFVQDDWRVHPRLTLNLGLRYDVNQPPVEHDDRWANFIISERRQVAAGTDGFPRALVRTHYDNLSPRVGFALRPFGDDRTVVRGGYGIFNSFDLQFTEYQLLGATAFPFTRLEIYQALAGQTGSLTLADPFPNRPGTTPGASSPNGWEYDNPTPYMQGWNLTFAREVLPNLGFEISYVGSKGTHLSSMANINQTIRTPQGPTIPFPGYTRVLVQRLGANSNYNAMDVSVQRRISGGLGFRSSFTWSKSLDNASFGTNSRLPQNPNDLAAERGLSEFDRRRVWNSDFIYELPFGRGRRYGSRANGWVDAFFGGWQVNGIIQLYDGRPFTPIASKANTQAGIPSRPDRLRDGRLDDPTIDRWFDVSAFAVVPTTEYRFGNSGRNILIGPGIVNIDGSIFKNFAMPWHEQRLQFRAEFFNIPNHANFGQPDARIDQPTGGTISSAGPGRQIQFGLKYLF